MLKSNLKTSVRNLLRNKMLLFVNLAGLSLSFSWVILTFCLVSHESSYDSFFVNKERIFRIDMYGAGTMQASNNGFFSRWEEVDSERNVLLPPALLPELSNQFAEIESYSRFQVNRQYIVDDGRSKLLMTDVIKADTSFFNVLGFSFVRGNQQKAFPSENSIVITESAAKKLFGERNPMNALVSVYLNDNEAVQYSVSGVVNDPPSNSSVKFSMVLPNSKWSRGPEQPPNNLSQLSTLGVVLLRRHADVRALSKKMNAFARTFYTDELKARNLTIEKFGVRPTAIADTHLDSISFGWPNQGRKMNIYAVSIISFIILVIAAINYSLIQITNSATRLNEIGVRKTFGASVSNIFVQFIQETFTLTTVSILLAAFVAILIVPLIGDILGLKIDLSSIDGNVLISGLILQIIFFSCLLGIYPAFYLARNKMMNLLNSSRTYRISPSLSKILVSLQFILCFIFIISVNIVERQLMFIEQKELGFKTAGIYAIDLYKNQATGDYGKFLKNFRSALESEPEIEHVSGGYNILDPGIITTSDEQQLSVFEFRGDETYAGLFKFELVEGSFPEVSTDDSTRNSKEGILINESLFKVLHNYKVGYKCEALKGMVIQGVIKDFNFRPLTQPVAPAFFRIDDTYLTTIFISSSSGDSKVIRKKITAAWSRLQDGRPLDLHTLEDNIKYTYQDQYQWGKVVRTAALIAVLISLFGLFGLSAVNSVNSRKEFAIRKVLGANSFSLLLQSNRFIVKILFLAFVVALPIAWYAMNSWLNNFSYRITITADIFVVSFLTCLVLSGLTTSYFTYRSININAAKTLRES